MKEIEDYIRRNRKKELPEPCPFYNLDDIDMPIFQPKFCIYLFPEIKGRGAWDSRCRKVSLGCPCKIFGKERVIEKVRELFPLKKGENRYPWEKNT